MTGPPDTDGAATSPLTRGSLQSPLEPPLGESRFLPGTVLAGRYRIIALLGRGGMGEVYRADDLRLRQPVALKMLPPGLASDPARLARFHNEVRLARQVTHPSVCRVHDIGEADGLTFLTMELVDGEDLASLLRRVGRLPAERAVVVARQICAGLAAAHEQGVLHRDLKPSNVMIDGRGRARLTDFGLAMMSGDARAGRECAGTPAYMAPEQIEGRATSPRTDVYSLGLLLYEMFTGHRAFEAVPPSHRSVPVPLTRLVSDLDPRIERVILQCLENDPERRPASPMTVAATLSGPDALAAAIAAGETPSPEMVAAAGRVGGLRPAVASAWLGAAIVAGILGYAAAFSVRPNLIQHVPLDRSPQVLADRARDMLARLRGGGRRQEQAYGLDYDGEIVRYIAQRDSSRTRWLGLVTGQPAALYFWYRESPQPMVANNRWGVVTPVEPPPTSSGMVTANLDLRGRLIYLRAISPPFEDPRAAGTPPDWSSLFTEAGLDLGRMRPAPAAWIPPVYADSRAAWDGSYSERPEIAIHVEAAVLHGKPVYFEIFGPWRQTPVPRGPGYAGFLILSAVALAAGSVFARRNLRLGRGDRRGAWRLATFVFVCEMLKWFLVASHAADVSSEVAMFTRATGASLFDAAAYWLYYIAVEPYARKLWPEMLVSWSRLLTGRPRDPLVGRDVLIGLLAGQVNVLVGTAVFMAPALTGASPRLSTGPDLTALATIRSLAGGMFGAVVFALQLSFLLLVVVLLLRMLLPARFVLPGGIVVLTTASIGIVDAWFGGSYPVDWLFMAAGAVVLLEVLRRAGFLSMVVAMMPFGLAISYPWIAPDLSAWHAGSFVIPAVVLVGLAVYGFRTALGGQPLFKDQILYN